LKSSISDCQPHALGPGDRLALVIATGFGAGFVPLAPGTAGTLVAIPLHLAISHLAPWLQILTTLAFVAVAVWAADRAGRYWGASDDARIVSDEIAGYFVTMALVPVSLKTVAAGFLLFRLFDIVKPPPASYFDQKVHNGVGNVMDDVFAGLYGRACLAALVWLWP
jgi:phosphatidylglycerophosphatase A